MKKIWLLFLAIPLLLIPACSEPAAEEAPGGEEATGGPTPEGGEGDTPENTE